MYSKIDRTVINALEAVMLSGGADGVPPRRSPFVDANLHRVGRSKRHPGVEVEIRAAHQLEIEPPKQYGQDESHLQSRKSHPDTVSWPTAEREVRVSGPFGRPIVPPPIRIERLRLVAEPFVTVDVKLRQSEG